MRAWVGSEFGETFCTACCVRKRMRGLCGMFVASSATQRLCTRLGKVNIEEFFCKFYFYNFGITLMVANCNMTEFQRCYYLNMIEKTNCLGFHNVHFLRYFHAYLQKKMHGYHEICAIQNVKLLLKMCHTNMSQKVARPSYTTCEREAKTRLFPSFSGV